MKTSLFAVIAGCALAGSVFAMTDSPPSKPPHARLADSPPSQPPHARLEDSPPSQPPHARLEDSPPSQPPHFIGS